MQVIPGPPVDRATVILARVVEVEEGQDVAVPVAELAPLGAKPVEQGVPPPAADDPGGDDGTQGENDRQQACKCHETHGLEAPADR